MSPEEVAARASGALGLASHVAFGQAVVDVPRGSWVPAVRSVRDDEVLRCSFFDLLTAVDELAEGFRVVVHLWSVEAAHGLLLQTSCPRDDPWVPSLTGVFGGAAWHERQAWEMFGISFDGHPSLTPLLLPDGFDGHPLRKEFVLAARVAKPWPGAKEPGESDRDLPRPGRRVVRPPGVPGPGAWPDGESG